MAASENAVSCSAGQFFALWNDAFLRASEEPNCQPLLKCDFNVLSSPSWLYFRAVGVESGKFSPSSPSPSPQVHQSPTNIGPKTNLI